MTRAIPNLTEISDCELACRALHRLVDPIERVMVYWNLHKRCFSVKQKGRVVAHTNYIAMIDASYKVSQAGRARVLREQRKNVHAYVIGHALDLPLYGFPTTKKIKYDPYENESFVDQDGLRIDYSRYCKMYKENQKPVILGR